MQAAPIDVPTRCDKCESVQLHRPDGDGALHCLRCLTAPAIKRSVEPTGDPPMLDVRPRAMPLGDQFRNAVIVVVLLFVIVLTFGSTCGAR